MAKEKTKEQLAIAAHVSKPATRNALRSFNLKAASAAGPLAASYWVTFLLTVMLPMLPSLLVQAAPKIMKSEKFRKALELTRDTIDGILATADE